jgi:aspartate oxidase
MKHQVVIAGSGLSALTAACRLVSRGVKDIALYAPAYGGTPFIAAIDFVLTGNPYHDTQSCYTDDMIRAGFGLNNPELVQAMVSHSEETCNFLTSLGIEFSRLDDGSLRRRHLSGSTYPRSLCSTNGLIGVEMIEKLTACLKKNSIELFPATRLSRFPAAATELMLWNSLIKPERH